MSMEEPRALKDGWAYIEDGEFHLKKDVPEWAKEEIAEINRALELTPDDDGLVTLY